MDQHVLFLEELKRLRKMKDEMDRLWKNLIEEGVGRKEDELWDWCESIPKFEGLGRKSPNLRLKKTIK